MLNWDRESIKFTNASGNIAVWMMKVGIDSLLPQFLCFNGLNRIQTPQSLFRDFRADKTFTGSHCWPLTALLRKTCNHTCDTDLVLEDLARTCYLPLYQSSAHNFAKSFFWFTGHWVKIVHRDKSACSGLNPFKLQSSRSRLMTCPRKTCLLRSQSNNTATSDGCTQRA